MGCGIPRILSRFLFRYVTADPLPLEDCEVFAHTKQAADVDSLEPQYPCPQGSSLFNAIKSSSNADWQRHLDLTSSLFDALDDISGVPSSDSHFHASFDPYYDNLSARQCHPEKPLPCKIDGNNSSESCVSKDQADAVYRMGHWEYSQIYRDSPDSLAASVSSYGVWVAELAAHLRDVIDGKSETLYFHNVAHDGSVSRLLSILQLDEMVWPGMGSEVVFELYKRLDAAPEPTATPAAGSSSSVASDSGFFVRVLFGGQVFKSSSPTLGEMDLIPVETLLGYFDELVGKEASKVKAKCE